MSAEKRAKETISSFRVFAGISKQETVKEVIQNGNFYNTREEAAKAYFEYQSYMPDYVIEFTVSGISKPSITFTDI